MKTDALTNRSAELGVIGCCLLGGLHTTLEAIQDLPPGAFTQSDCSEAWLVLEAMANQGKPIDTPRFSQEWPKLSESPIPQAILSAADQVPSASNLSYYSEIVRESFQRRQVAYAGQLLTSKASDATMTTDQVVSEAEQLLLEQKLDTSKTFDGGQGAEQLTEFLEQSYTLHQQGKRSGISTGFTHLDRITDGLQRGEQAIIAARPSMGKTAIGLNIVERACMLDGIPTAFITLEMSARALLRRLCSAWGGIPLHDLKTGCYIGDPVRASKVVSFFSILRKSKLKIHEAVNGIDSTKLCAVIRRLVSLHKVELVVIDYLQKIKAPEKHEKRTYEVAQVSGALKALAVQTGVAMVTLAQLNRDSEKDKKPRMPRLTDLADSGQIERDADMVALLHRSRAEGGPHDASLLIAKQRDGELGCVELTFDGAICRFSNRSLFVP